MTIGDYNINLPNSSTDKETSNFLDAIITYSVLPMITQPTRYGVLSTRYGAQSATLIDNVITYKYLGQHLSAILLNDFSDHIPIFLLLGTFYLNATQNNL